MGFDEDGAIMRPWYILKAENDNAIRASAEPADLAQMVEETTFQYDGYYTLPTREFLPGEEAPSTPTDAQPPWYKFLYSGGTYIGATATIKVYEEIDESSVSYSSLGSEASSGSVSGPYIATPAMKLIQGLKGLVDFGSPWKIFRDANAKATATSGLYGTIAKLASIVGLNPNEFKMWLTLPKTVKGFDGEILYSKDLQIDILKIDDKLMSNQIFEVPNTIFSAFFPNNFIQGILGKFESDNTFLRSKKIAVKTYNAENAGSTKEERRTVFMNMLRQYYNNKELWGLHISGHGGHAPPVINTSENARFGARPAEGGPIVYYNELGLPYKLAVFYGFTCFSSFGEPTVLYNGGKHKWTSSLQLAESHDYDPVTGKKIPGLLWGRPYIKAQW